MEENRYVATPGKTFLCFVIYRVVILITSGIVDFFVVSVFLNFLMESVGEDNILFKILINSFNTEFYSSTFSKKFFY